MSATADEEKLKNYFSNWNINIGSSLWVTAGESSPTASSTKGDTARDEDDEWNTEQTEWEQEWAE